MRWLAELLLYHGNRGIHQKFQGIKIFTDWPYPPPDIVTTHPLTYVYKIIDYTVLEILLFINYGRTLCEFSIDVMVHYNIRATFVREELLCKRELENYQYPLAGAKLSAVGLRKVSSMCMLYYAFKIGYPSSIK